MKAIKLEPKSWNQILNILHSEHPPSVFAIRDKMKRVLGFTVRQHNQWVSTKQQDDESIGRRGYYDEEIHLDFYSENKRTLFLLKFSEYIHTADGNREHVF